MENTQPVKQAVESGAIVVACAYQGRVSDEVTASLPAGFAARSYVAEYLDGRLVAIRAGAPESVITSMLTE